MPKVLVCYKWVLDEQDIRINPETQALDLSRAKYKISDYDRNAMEAAAQLREKLGWVAEALSFGTADVKQSLKDALSRGLDKAYYIADAAAEKADAFVTANVLAAAVRRIGPYDLILSAEGSADIYNQQTGPRLAALLGLPAITCVERLNAEGGKIIATRKLADCTEVASAPGAVVVSVLPEIAKARIPGLKQVLAAAKKPSEEIKLADLDLTAEDLAPKATRVSVKGFVMSRKKAIFKDADPKSNIGQLVARLAHEGLA